MAGNLMMAMLQSGDTAGNTQLLTILIILIAVAMVTQAIVIIVAAAGAMKTQKKLGAIADELRAAAVPFLVEARGMVNKSAALIDDVGPAVRAISRNVETASGHIATASGHIAVASQSLKNKTQELDELTSEIKQRTQVQVRRVDGMVTGALTAVSEITHSIHKAILVPVREIAGLMNGVKAGLDTLMGRARDFGVIPGGRTARREDDTRL
jgi:methyl-accepting chemotaxis protein